MLTYIAPEAISQISTVLSRLPEASRLPSGLKTTERTGQVAAEGAHQLAARHIPQLHGLIPTARGQPLAIRAEGHRVDGTGMTGRVYTSSPLATSHSFTVWSSLPKASRVPSGLKASD